MNDQTMTSSHAQPTRIHNLPRLPRLLCSGKQRTQPLQLTLDKLLFSQECIKSPKNLLIKATLAPAAHDYRVEDRGDRGKHHDEL